MPNLNQSNKVLGLVSTTGAVGSHVQINFPLQGDPENALCPKDLRAVTWPEGKRIDLFWTTPKGATRIVIKRSFTAHSAYIEDDTEVIYNGPPVDHFIDGKIVTQTIGHPVRQQSPALEDVGVPNTAEDLKEGSFYYYTIYMTSSPDPIGIYDFGGAAEENCQVTGLSAPDYLAREGNYGGEYFYQSFDDPSRGQDQDALSVTGRTTGYLQDFSRWLQGSVNVQRAMTERIADIPKFNITTPGNIGFAEGQASILSNIVKIFGFQPERSVLDVNVMRRLAYNAVFFLKEKGTCAGLVDLVKIVTQWDSECTEINDAAQGFFLETWDGTSELTSYSYPSSLLNSSVGSLLLPGPILPPNKYDGGLLISGMGNIIPIDSNTSDTIYWSTFSEVTGETTGTVTVSAGVDITLTTLPGGPSGFDDGAYDGYQLLDSNNVVFTVVSTTAPNQIELNAAGCALGAVAISTFFGLGPTFADRDPQTEIYLWSGGTNNTFIWDTIKPLVPASFWGGTEPLTYDLFYDGGSLLGLPFNDEDVIIEIEEGVALFTFQFEIYNLGTGIIEISPDPGLSKDSIKGYYINPNRNQTELWEITGNNGVEITVKVPNPLLRPSDVAAGQKSQGFVLSRSKADRYKQLARLTKRALPFDSKAFIHFK